eukprot:TRINITY_DN10491_c0_g1_i3.p2 TRINITY_DN10491_c0_g1~~TRINITY_DN10491_c0_g1_i3.p2  ORF type:complete len:156 (-),score=11.73 TRINITY_DN10491_c0_g1_i3:299-766(-)
MLRLAFGRYASGALCPSLLVGSARGTKDSTYLTGVPVDPKAELNTPGILQGLIDKVESKVPEGTAYRTHVTNYCSRFLDVIKSSSSQAEAESILGRQFEQIQIDVQHEMEVVDMMAAWKPWETREGHAPRVFANYQDIPSNVREFRQFQHDLASK